LQNKDGGRKWLINREAAHAFSSFLPVPGRRRREGYGKKLDNNGKNRADSGHRLNFAYNRGKAKYGKFVTVGRADCTMLFETIIVKKDIALSG